jgi:hypothetical protein
VKALSAMNPRFPLSKRKKVTFPIIKDSKISKVPEAAATSAPVLKFLIDNSGICWWMLSAKLI